MTSQNVNENCCHKIVCDVNCVFAHSVTSFKMLCNKKSLKFLEISISIIFSHYILLKKTEHGIITQVYKHFSKAN